MTVSYKEIQMQGAQSLKIYYIFMNKSLCNLIPSAKP
jgi:hypothetical protein